MAISNFIPTVWSETLLSELDHDYIGVRNCSRDFEGDIRGKGSSVKINGIGDISVFDYTKDTDMQTAQDLSDTSQTLLIDQAKAFNFQIDDVDRAQSTPKLMQAAMSQAAAALSDVADAYVYSLYKNVAPTNTIAYSEIVAEDVLDILLDARRVLLSHGVNSNIPTSLEVSPEVAALIIKSKILNNSDNTAALENGALGSFIGFDVYVSPNIAVVDNRYKCLARTKRAIAFAEQLNEVEAYRPENRFADAVKGLHLYGAKVVYPDEVVLLDLSVG
ncbi:MAG: hypothetical protein IJ493_11720 [Clostridia bacterium]|nr:hypothetical protein [Clostridia bacterium]